MKLVNLGVFTLAEAITEDVSPERLRRSDIVRLGQGIYTLRNLEYDDVTIARAVCRAFENSWISNRTGGIARGLTLPKSLKLELPEVSRQRPANLPRLSIIKGYRATVRYGEVTRIDKIPVSTPARVWLELASMLTIDELVEFGDHLVRIPRQAFEGRTEPYATIAQMRQFLSWHRRMAGADKAHAALELIRVGADSVKETQFRLAMVEAGLPEPELQVKLDPKDPHSPVADLGYRKPRIAIDYDGESHLTAEQQSRDIQRSRKFTVAGWRHVTANRDDAAEGFRTVIGVIRTLLAGGS